MERTASPSFDLIVATMNRTEELARLLSSLQAQTYASFRVLIADQNEDDRLHSLLDEFGSLELIRVRSSPGLCRARNAALTRIDADVIAFPDDDCLFPADLLQRVASRFASDETLAGMTGRSESAAGESSASWRRDPAILTEANVWNRAISFTIFLRAKAVAATGGFDEELGLGAGGPWTSGEEIDYLVRAIRKGFRIEYDPDLIVVHDVPALPAGALREIGARDGASVGYILRKHGYPLRRVALMLARPIGGALVAVLRKDTTRARFHLATLRGRLLGYRNAAQPGL